MKQLLLPAVALAVIAAPAAHAASTTSVKSAAKAEHVRITRAENECLKNARSKYKAGDMRNRAEAKCRSEAQAALQRHGEPGKPKAK